MGKKRKRKRSKRRTYKKKSVAKKHCPKGRSVYKVLGGWRVSR